MTSNDPDPAPNALQLWRTLRFFIEQACVLIGMPAALAQRLWLSRGEHRQFAAILRPLERLLRRLVFLEAAKLQPEPPRHEQKQRPRRAMPASFGAHFDMEDAASWRVCFNLAAAPARVVRPIDSRSHADFINALASAPLALRLEALIRGFNDPDKLARRLARSLRRAPEIIARMLAPLSPREASHPFAFAGQQAGGLCRAATLRPADTSQSSLQVFSAAAFSRHGGGLRARTLLPRLRGSCRDAKRTD